VPDLGFGLATWDQAVPFQRRVSVFLVAQELVVQ
jgi:hypothetical protein